MAPWSRATCRTTPLFRIAVSHCCTGAAAHERIRDPHMAFGSDHDRMGVARHSSRHRTNRPLFIRVQHRAVVADETRQLHVQPTDSLQRNLSLVTLAVSPRPYAAGPLFELVEFCC